MLLLAVVPLEAVVVVPVVVEAVEEGVLLVTVVVSSGMVFLLQLLIPYINKIARTYLFI